MGASVGDITSAELRLFGSIIACLETIGAEADARAAVLGDIVRLLRADFGASYVWAPARAKFVQSVGINMDEGNLARYDAWYQFRDPITFRLRARRSATPVDAVLPRRALERSEFYNDFLARDGLHHGIDMFVFDGDRDLGDLRIWRAAGRPDFGAREIALLDSLEPFLRRALLRQSTGRADTLTPRERDVAALVARGCTDRDIGRILGIGFSTVRTHLQRALEKRGCANRAELAAQMARGQYPTA